MWNALLLRSNSLIKLSRLFRVQHRNVSRAAGVENGDKFDLVVIGGGSGGLACAKEAVEHGKKVAVLDFVKPSPLGTSWGLGGTCVNVGCIPKKLMHHVAQLDDQLNTAARIGWANRLQEKAKNGPSSIDWATMSSVVQDYVHSLNWGHRVQLQEKSVTYFNAQASFHSPNVVSARDKNGKEFQLHAENIVIAVGGRPNQLNIPHAKDLCITSDDLFWLDKPPGKTLVVGASYVALECAGFLHGMGFEVQVMVRSIPLRHFDQQMAALVCGDMESSRGIKFHWKCVPEAVERTSEGRVKVVWKNVASNETFAEVFDTVLVATGRTAVTHSLNLDAAGVQFDNSDMKVIGGHDGDAERTSQKHIYAIGDVLKGGIELTPVAIRAGRLLARRLFGQSREMMDYSMVPTTVFTPLEYGCVGLSEEAAVAKCGADNIEIYHAFYKPLEYVLSQHDPQHVYIKVICDLRDNLRIIGFHITGPNAGEITQGFAAAIKIGLTYQQLTEVVGIHPTAAEEVVKLRITKRSGQDAGVTGC